MRAVVIVVLLIPSCLLAQGLTQHATVTQSGNGESVVVVKDVAIDGDTLVVAAKTKHAAMQIYHRVGGEWRLKKHPSLGIHWAHAVAIDDGTIVVGTRASAFVFANHMGQWLPQAELTFDHSSGIGIGVDVAISGDTIVVAAPSISSQASAMPDAAYVFTRTGSLWTKQATLMSDEPRGSFGHSVAIDGNTIVVGTKNRGAVYVFSSIDGTWQREAKLTRPDDRDFGASVGIDGETIVVGDTEVSPSDPDCTSVFCRRCGEATSRCGSVYVFTRSDRVWTEQARLRPSDDRLVNLFGRYIAIEGDTIVVGTRGFHANGFDSGVAYVFGRSGGTWTKQEKLSPYFVVTDLNTNIATHVDISAGNIVTGNRFGAFYFSYDVR